MIRIQIMARAMALSVAAFLLVGIEPRAEAGWCACIDMVRADDGEDVCYCTTVYPPEVSECTGTVDTYYSHYCADTDCQQPRCRVCSMKATPNEILIRTTYTCFTPSFGGCPPSPRENCRKVATYVFFDYGETCQMECTCQQAEACPEWYYLWDPCKGECVHGSCMLDCTCPDPGCPFPKFWNGCSCN